MTTTLNDSTLAPAQTVKLHGSNQAVAPLPTSGRVLSHYPESPGVIYFLNAQGTDFWKVGFCRSAKGVKGRILELQTGCPHRLILVALKTNTTQQYETKIHLLMKRHRMVGEWFRFNEWMEAFMDGFRIDGRRIC